MGGERGWEERGREREREEISGGWRFMKKVEKKG